MIFNTNPPIPIATTVTIGGVIAGSGLSINNNGELSVTVATTAANGLMSSSDKTKLDGVATGAEVNVNADWNATSGDAKILNKPTTISGYGITDAYTKTQVDGLVSGVLHYKGTKTATSALPSSSNTTGDVWHVSADGSEWAWDGTTWQELGTATDLSNYVTHGDTGSATAAISIADHSTTTIYGVSSSTTSVRGVQSSTTTASKVTLGDNFSVPNITAVGSGSFTQGTFNGGSGSASLTFTMDTTDTKKLKISFSHTHTPATHGTDTHVHTAPTLGTAFSIPNVTSASDVIVPIKNTSTTTVPIKNTSSTTVVTSATHSITDNGHTHTI